MIFNSKQLEELENIHDSTGAFEEEGDDEGGFDEVGEAAMDWRRGLIEEAAENIKRAKTRPVESHLTYPIGSMLFERDARRFARVQRSVPGYLKVVYLSGGDREFGTLDVTGYLRDYGAEKRLSELAEQLGMNDGDVAAELERLGISPLEEPEGEEPAAEEEAAAAVAATPPPPPLPRARKAAAPVEDEVDEVDDEVEADTAETEPLDDELPVDDENDASPPKGLPRGAAKAAPSKGAPTKAPPTKAALTKAEPTKAALTKAAPTKAAPVLPVPPRGATAKASAPKPAPAASTKAAPPSAKAAATKSAAPPAKAPAGKAAPSKGGDGKINPIDDPNSYIKAHFQEMSNRELARLTGLSEHTIRRKLGEWGLKRKHA
jgi:hypothetical protein